MMISIKKSCNLPISHVPGASGLWKLAMSGQSLGVRRGDEIVVMRVMIVMIKRMGKRMGDSTLLLLLYRQLQNLSR